MSEPRLQFSMREMLVGFVVVGASLASYLYLLRAITPPIPPEIPLALLFVVVVGGLYISRRRR